MAICKQGIPTSAASSSRNGIADVRTILRQGFYMVLGTQGKHCRIDLQLLHWQWLRLETLFSKVPVSCRTSPLVASESVPFAFVTPITTAALSSRPFQHGVIA